MEDVSIRIELAGRAYPVTVQEEETDDVLKAVEWINTSMERLKAAYPLTDTQDLLAMAALEVTVKALQEVRNDPETRAMQAELDKLLRDLGS